MPQQQAQKSGDPPLGACAVCGEPVTRDDPGRLQFSATSGRMTQVHDRCRAEAATHDDG
jgi:hypothetical protein